MYQFKELTIDYNVMSKLGSGTYGDVYEVSDKKTDNVYAMKISYIAKNFINPIILREITNVVKYDHPNIIKLHYVNFGLYNAQKCVYLLFEKCNCSLFDTLYSNNNGEINFAELLDSIDYLHQNDYYHGDASFSNVLIKNKNIMLIDFGSTQRSYRKYDKELPPSLIVRPIELLNGSKNEYIDGKTVDYWSIGCILHKFLTGNFLIDLQLMKDKINIIDIKNKIVEIYKNKLISDNYKKILVNLINPDLQKRKMIQMNENNYLAKINDSHTNYKQYSLFVIANDNIKFKIIDYLNKMIRENDLESEILFLTIANSKKIKINQSRKNDEKYIINLFLNLFWLSNKIISSRILSFDEINYSIIYLGLNANDFEKLYYYIIKELNWDIDSCNLYNYIGYFFGTIKVYYEGFILFLELTNYIQHKSIDGFISIYHIFKTKHNFHSPKIETFIAKMNYENKRVINNTIKRIEKHVYDIFNNDKYSELNKFVKYCFEVNKQYHVYMWITNVMHE